MWGARLAQSVEHQTFNLRVKGSSPLSGVHFLIILACLSLIFFFFFFVMANKSFFFFCHLGMLEPDLFFLFFFFLSWRTRVFFVCHLGMLEPGLFFLLFFFVLAYKSFFFFPMFWPLKIFLCIVFSPSIPVMLSKSTFYFALIRSHC